MQTWWRRSLYAIAGLVLLTAGLALWLVLSFDGERFQRAAVDWMSTRHARRLVFDGPVTLQLWPQPAVAVQRVSLSEPGQPQQVFARIERAALSLKLRPLLLQREVVVDHVSASGAMLRFSRDAAGVRNVDDLLGRVTADSAPRTGPALRIDSLELRDAELELDDAVAGLRGRISVRLLELGAFGPGLVTPLQLQAQAAMSEPPLQAALELDAGLSLLPAPQMDASPVLQLDGTSLRLRGDGFDVEGLDAALQARVIRMAYGVGQGRGESQVEIQGLQLQFGGRRLGWQIDSGEMALSRLTLDVLQRKLQLEQLALQLQGRRESGTLAVQLRWPSLAVHGDRLQGSALEGGLQLGGDARLQLRLKSQSPQGAFERITLPDLQLAIDGQFGSSAVAGELAATLVIEPQPRAVDLQALTLKLRLDEPTLVPLQLALDGHLRLSPEAGSGRLDGRVNEQRVEARLDARFDRPRPLIDLQASSGTLDLDRFTAPARRGAAPAPAAANQALNLQPLRWADARLQVSVSRLLRAPYRIDALEFLAQVDDGVLDLRRLAGRAWGGRFDASGRADAAGGNLALRLRAEDVDLRNLLADTTGHDGLRGRARIDADLRSRGASVGALRAALNGSARLTLRPAALRGVDLPQTLRGWRSAAATGSDTVTSEAARQTEFSELQGSFDVRNGIARNDDLAGRSEFLSLGGEGTIDLVQGRLDYLLRARVINTAGGRAGPEMVLLNGVTVPVELHGPFGNIEWQVRWGTVTAAVAARSVPNVAVGTVSGVARGATGVARGATGVVRGAGGVLRSVPGALTPAPR